MLPDLRIDFGQQVQALRRIGFGDHRQVRVKLRGYALGHVGSPGVSRAPDPDLFEHPRNPLARDRHQRRLGDGRLRGRRGSGRRGQLRGTSWRVCRGGGCARGSGRCGQEAFEKWHRAQGDITESATFRSRRALSDLAGEIDPGLEHLHGSCRGQLAGVGAFSRFAQHRHEIRDRRSTTTAPKGSRNDRCVGVHALEEHREKDLLQQPAAFRCSCSSRRRERRSGGTAYQEIERPDEPPAAVDLHAVTPGPVVRHGVGVEAGGVDRCEVRIAGSVVVALPAREDDPGPVGILSQLCDRLV